MADLTPELIIERLGLVPLEPEGGFVGQTYFGERASAIHYLMAGGAVSGLHRLERLEIWAWRGEPFAADELAVLRGLRLALDGALGEELRALLDPIEVRATARRIDALVTAGVFPQPDPRRPALPWPPV